MRSNSSVSSPFPVMVVSLRAQSSDCYFFQLMLLHLQKIISSFDVSKHSFADDLFVDCSTKFRLSKVDLQIPPKLEAAVEAVCDWHTDNGMLLNAPHTLPHVVWQVRPYLFLKMQLH